MSGKFCIGFIDFTLKGKSLLDYTNLFYSNDYEKNDKIRYDKKTIIRNNKSSRMNMKNYLKLKNQLKY